MILYISLHLGTKDVGNKQINHTIITIWILIGFEEQSLNTLTVNLKTERSIMLIIIVDGKLARKIINTNRLNLMEQISLDPQIEATLTSMEAHT